MAAISAAIVEVPWRTSRASWKPVPIEPSIRILTVDEHPLVREGLAAVINKQSGMAVVAEASTSAEALAAYRKYRPDVVTLDLQLPDISGEELASQILAEFPQARIVVITSARGDVRMMRALKAGVRGFFLKGMPNEELVEAIRSVYAGRRVVPRQVASALAEHLGDETLTPREVEVLRLVAQGNRNKEVACRLSIADETVRMHMKNILGKLAANDRTHAVTIALTRGVFQL